MSDPAPNPNQPNTPPTPTAPPLPDLNLPPLDPSPTPSESTPPSPQTPDPESPLTHPSSDPNPSDTPAPAIDPPLADQPLPSTNVPDAPPPPPNVATASNTAPTPDLLPPNPDLASPPSPPPDDPTPAPNPSDSSSPQQPTDSPPTPDSDSPLPSATPTPDLDPTPSLPEPSPDPGLPDPASPPTDTPSPPEPNPAPNPELSTPPPPDNQLTRLASKYSINIQKPHFPVNTLRLYYLLLTDTLTNGHESSLDLTNQLIPRISTLLNSRERLAGPDSNPAVELKTCAPQIKAITDLISTPIITTFIDHLFTYIYPLQDSLLLSLDPRLQQDSLTSADLHSTLKIRAMDSIAYSTIISEVINQHPPSSEDNQATPPSTKPFGSSLHYQINLTSQINDIVDAVVYAKQDLEAGSATLINIIRKIHSDPAEVEKLITSTLDSFISKSALLPLPDPAQSAITDFNRQLASVLKTSSPPNNS